MRSRQIGLAGGSLSLESEGVVHGLHGRHTILAIDEHGDLDLACRDHADIDLLPRESREHAAGDAFGMLHAHAHDGNLRQLRIVRHARGPELLRDAVGEFERLRQIVYRHGERDVGLPPLPDVLHDHVDRDP